MSKIITLSNLERFHGHLNFSGGSGYIKTIATNDTTGNIYVNTSDGKLYYKSNGSWSAITLYSSKPRAKNLVLRVSNALKYAGLVDPSDANASKIRVRIGNTIYAVETEHDDGWEVKQTFSGTVLSLTAGNYIRSKGGIPFWGDSDIDIHLVASISKKTSYYTSERMFFRCIDDEITDPTAYTNSVNNIRLSSFGTKKTTTTITSGILGYYLTSAGYLGGSELVQDKDATTTYGTVYGVYYAYDIHYTASNNLYTLTFNNQTSPRISASTLLPYTGYVVLGNTTFGNITADINVNVKEFYLKVNGQTVLNLDSMRSS